MAYTVALCSAVGLAGCGSDGETAENEMQSEAGNDLREEPGARGVTPTTPGKISEEGQLGDDEVEADMTGPRIGDNTMTPAQSIVENISADSDLSMLLGALRQADLVKVLNGTGPYTIFAPTNEAFEALPNGTLDDLMQPENRQRLINLLNNHVVAGKITAADLTDGATLKTASGKQLMVTKKGNDVMVSGAKVEQPDMESSNGVIHIIEKVITVEK